MKARFQRRCPIPVSGLLLREKLFRMNGSSPLNVPIVGRFVIAVTKPLIMEPGRNKRFIRFGKYAQLISGPITGSPTTNTHSLLVIGNTSEQIPPPTSTTPRIEGCTAGDTILVVDRPVTANKWYFLYDANRMETHRTNSPPLTRGIGGELVFVKTYAYDEVELRDPLTQSYGGTGSDVVLVDVSDRVCENISIRGGKFIGKRQAGMRAHIDCGMVAGLKIQGCAFDTGWVAAVAAYGCRNVQIRNCTADKFSQYNGYATGYTFLFDRSVVGTLDSLLIRDTRYGVSVSRGSADWLVNGVLGEKCRDGAIDVHGGDCYNGTFQNIIAQVDAVDGSTTSKPTLRIGNSDWRRGASSVTLKDSYAFQVVLDSAIRDSTIENVSGVRAVVQGAGQDPNVGAPAGKFDNVEFLSCSFDTGTSGVDAAFKCIAGPLPAPQYLWFQELKLTDCTIAQSSSAFLPAFSCESVSTGSSCLFDSCTVKNLDSAATSSGKLMYLGAPKPAYLSGSGDPIEVTWASTTALMPNRDPFYPAVGLGSVSTGVSSVTFFDDTTGATPNRRGPTLGSLNDLSEDDFVNVTYEVI